MILSTLPTVLLAVLPLAGSTALSRPDLDPAAVEQQHPLITASPATLDPTRTYKKRNLVSDVEGDVNSILSGLGSDVPSYVASGVPNFFQDFPTRDKVSNSLGLNDSQIAALPTQVLNIP